MSSCWYTSPPTFGNANFLLSFFSFFFNFSYSIRCVVVSDFNLQLPKDIWYWVSFNMLIWHLYIFFGGVSAQIFCPYCNCFVFFSLLSLRVLVYILDTSPLSDIYMFCKYFLPVCGLLFILLTMSFVEQKFLIIRKSNTTVFFFMDRALGCI